VGAGGIVHDGAITTNSNNAVDIGGASNYFRTLYANNLSVATSGASTHSIKGQTVFDQGYPLEYPSLGYTVSIKNSGSRTASMALGTANGDTTNFDLTFTVVTHDKSPFEALVVDQKTLDSGKDIEFKKADGTISGNIVTDNGNYQNYN
jgi:hypothetical protein